MTTTIDEELVEYLDGCIGVVEANSFETMCLWEKARASSRTWISSSMGYGKAVSRVDGLPAFISLMTASVDGQKILFIDPTSELVDWNLIEEWLKANLPKTAFRESGYINKTDAMNFWSVFTG